MAAATSGGIEPLEGHQGLIPLSGGDAGAPIPKHDAKALTLRRPSLQDQPQRRCAVTAGVLDQIGHSPGECHRLHDALQGLQLQRQGVGIQARRHLGQQLIQRHRHGRLVVVAAREQQKLLRDPLQGRQIGLSLPQIHSRQAGQAEPKAQTGDRAFEVVGDAAQHHGPLLLGALQAPHHGIEAAGELAHSDGAALLWQSRRPGGGAYPAQGPLQL